MLSKLKLSTRIVTQSIVIVICFTLLLGWVYTMMRGRMLNEKTTATKNSSTAAVAIPASTPIGPEGGRERVEWTVGAINALWAD